MKGFKRILQVLNILFAVAMIGWYLISAIISIGSIAGTLFFALWGAAAIWFEKLSGFVRKLREKRSTRILVNTVIAVTAAGIVYTAAILCTMLGFSLGQPEEGATLVVLGCQVNGDQPSLMLSRRIRAAYDYLTEHPDTKCIVSGGKGNNESISEAECMYNRLTQMGIEPSRIYMEDRSANTAENIRFSGEIISREGLSRELAIVTDGFHEMRASMIASKEGYHSGAVPAKTPLYLAANFTTREVLAVTAELLLH